MSNLSSLRYWFPAFYLPDAGIDRRRRKRIVPMKVLALRLGRTGTTCLPVLSSKSNSERAD